MRLAMALACALLLIGCATKYHPADGCGGYAEKRLGDDLYQVSFRSNSYTPEERVAAYLLYRAAEIARREGAAAFIVHHERVAAATAKPRLRPSDERTAVITVQLLSKATAVEPPREIHDADALLRRLHEEMPDLP